MNQDHYAKAINYLQHYGFSDLFFSQPEYQFIFDHIESAIDVLAWIDKSLLSHQKVDFLEPLNDLFPMGRYDYRHGALLDPFLDIYAMALVFKNKEQIEKFRPSKLSNTVFSYRLHKGEDAVLFDPTIGWAKFNDVSINLANKLECVGMVDIAGFYASIRPAHFDNIGFSEIFSGDDHIRLKAILNHIGLSKNGLPVGGDFARVLGEIVLAHVDRNLRKAGVTYARFVDDFRIFSHDEVAMRRDVYHLTNELNSYGLHINRQKISIMSGQDFIETLTFKSASLIVGDAQKESVLNPLFDPYAELVIGRVEDLKAISKTQSLHQAIQQELEKVSADMTSLKIIISALQYCPIDEAVLTLDKILDHINQPEIQVVMLRLVRVIASRNKDFSTSSRKNLSTRIENIFMSGIHEFPFAVQAHLLNARHSLNTILGANFENSLALLYQQTNHDHLKRNIYFLLVSHGKNKTSVLNLNSPSLTCSQWLKVAHDITTWQQNAGSAQAFGISENRPMQHLITKMR